MAIHSKGFIYNGRSTSEFNVKIATIGSFDTHQDLGMTREVVRDRPIDSFMDIIYGSFYSSNLEFTITVIKEDESRFTNSEIRQLNKWLIGYNYPKKLELDSCVLGMENVYFNCLFTSVSTTSIGGIIGLTYNVVCDAPYGYEDFNVTYEISETNSDVATEIMFYNTSDENEEYLYPIVKITKTGNGDISIISSSDVNNDITLEGLVDGEVVTIDSLRQTINSTEQTFTNTLGGYDNFNHNWLRLLPGNNIIGVYGDCILEISGKYARKVGI